MKQAVAIVPGKEKGRKVVSGELTAPSVLHFNESVHLLVSRMTMVIFA